jgi:hypothetical protein
MATTAPRRLSEGMVGHPLQVEIQVQHEIRTRLRIEALQDAQHAAVRIGLTVW